MVILNSILDERDFLVIERVKILRMSTTHSQEWLLRGNNDGTSNFSSAHTTAMNAHYCVIIRALGETKRTWPRLGEMRTQRTQFKQSIVGRGHICRILRDSWHLYLLFVYIWAFAEMLKLFCKSSLYFEKLKKL